MREAPRNGLSTIAKFMPELLGFLLILVLGYYIEAAAVQQATPVAGPRSDVDEEPRTLDRGQT